MVQKHRKKDGTMCCSATEQKGNKNIHIKPSMKSTRLFYKDAITL